MPEQGGERTMTDERRAPRRRSAWAEAGGVRHLAAVGWSLSAGAVAAVVVALIWGSPQQQTVAAVVALAVVVVTWFVRWRVAGRIERMRERGPAERGTAERGPVEPGPAERGPVERD
jgi:Flp pilus assembly protein TadB